MRECGPVPCPVCKREEVEAEAIFSRAEMIGAAHFFQRCPFYSRGWEMTEYILFLFFPRSRPGQYRKRSLHTDPMKIMLIR